MRRNRIGSSPSLSKAGRETIWSLSTLPFSGTAHTSESSPWSTRLQTASLVTPSFSAVGVADSGWSETYSLLTVDPMATLDRLWLEEAERAPASSGQLNNDELLTAQ